LCLRADESLSAHKVHRTDNSIACYIQEGLRPAPFAAGDEDPTGWGIVLVKAYPWIATEEAAFPAVLPGLERFDNSRALAGIEQGGFNLHPSDEDLSLGTRVRKKPLSGCG
jgi:hypothetical protein